MAKERHSRPDPLATGRRRAGHALPLLAALAAGLAGPAAPAPGCSDGSRPGTDPCLGRQCGPAPGDPAVSCGACAGRTERCSVDGRCEDLCLGRQCGPAPEEPTLSCGTCTGPTERCSVDGRCEDLCLGRQCGEPAPGISCGQCEPPRLCGLPGLCFLPGGCPEGTVEVGLTGVCIDAHEVTVARMAEFLTANGPVCHPDWAFDYNDDYPCGGQEIFVHETAIRQEPSGEFVPVERYRDYPATWVTYPGARMACQYFGGDLCTYEEWARACEGPEQRTYCYGETYDASACNACNPSESPEVCSDADPDQPEPVGSRPTCEGGYPGLFDMSGNVWEWVQNPEPGLEGFETATTMGGAPYAGSNNTMCRPRIYVGVQVPYTSGPSTGFRCCYHLE